MKITKYKNVEVALGELPSELRVMLKSIADDNRLAILFLLVKHEEMPFSHLAKLLDIPTNALSHHLKNLSIAGLVDNFFGKKDASSGEYSHYKPSHLGKELMEKLINVILPHKDLQQEQDELMKDITQTTVVPQKVKRKETVEVSNVDS